MVKNFLGFVIGLVVSLIILELFVSSAAIETKSTTDFNTVIGRTKRANLDFTLFNEGFSMGTINRYGYLGTVYPPEKELGTIRIALLGDSYVESFQLFRRDQFHSIIEEKLSMLLGQPVEVLNFGRSGFDLADMYAYQINFANKFHPDLILYFLSEADLLCTQTDVLLPKVILKGDTPIITNDLMPKSRIEEFENTKFLTQNSAILQMLNNSRKLVKRGLFWPKMLDKFYFKDQSITELSVPTSDTIPELALKIAKNLSKNVVIVNRGEEPLSDKFTEVIHREQLPFVDLNDTLSVMQKSGIDPSYWKVTKKRGHWNYQGHQAVGLYLTNQLEKIVKENPDYQNNFR